LFVKKKQACEDTNAKVVAQRQGSTAAQNGEHCVAKLRGTGNKGKNHIFRNRGDEEK
jgi:hypothetical protein